ncbi:MAG: endonuclease MutS2 [Clostridiales bacterium]|nr:endonuclease MutS2 [Clostridiales bacterium]
MIKDYKKLELDKVLYILSEQAYSDKCKEFLRNLEPYGDFEKVQLEMAKTESAFNLSVKYGTPPFTKIIDICESVKRAYQGSKLSLKELLDTAKLLRQAGKLNQWKQGCGETETVLTPIFERLYVDDTLEKAISDSILSEEEISDSASPELFAIRKKIARMSSSIRERLEKLVKNKDTQKYLQDSLITIRDGRYVVPVKAEHKGAVSGLVHDSSASGSTLFVEPMAVVEANNEIRILKGKEQQEIERIITKLSADSGSIYREIEENFHALIELEGVFVKANFAAKTNAVAPKLVEEPVIILNKARHPLIDAEKVVPISLQLDNEKSCLIITGPNTGGKTVALKTTGLLTLMAMCGMMIPAGEGTVIGSFDKILADIGDEQSIEQSLSTFSSHMKNIVDILEIADDKTLVLLDELGSGTDPIEGSALAVSILTKLMQFCSKIIATTHYQEVKIFALQTDGVENASCEFDVETLKPTYRLILGTPGKSNAFAISSRLGMPNSVIEYARTLVNSQDLRFEEVVDALEKSRKELEKVKVSLDYENQQAKLLHEEYEKKLTRLEQEKEKELENARSKAMSMIEEIRHRSNILISELEQIKKEKKSEALKSGFGSVKSRTEKELDKLFDKANPVISKRKESYKLPRKLILGDRVLLIDIDKQGNIIKLPDKQGNCLVQVGIIKTKTNISNLKLIEEKKVDKKDGRVIKSVTSVMERKASMELDIRGMSSDEGIIEADRFIDNSIMSGISLITIIHGKGTGVLRSAVHEFLRTHPSVKSFRLGVYGEGESGVTVVELKN